MGTLGYGGFIILFCWRQGTLFVSPYSLLNINSIKNCRRETGKLLVVYYSPHRHVKILCWNLRIHIKEFPNSIAICINPELRISNEMLRNSRINFNTLLYFAWGDISSLLFMLYCIYFRIQKKVFIFISKIFPSETVKCIWNKKRWSGSGHNSGEH